MVNKTIYDSNFQKPSSEPNGKWHCGLVCKIVTFVFIMSCSNDERRLNLTYFMAETNLLNMF